MFCQNCGKELAVGSQSCAACGTKTSTTAPAAQEFLKRGQTASLDAWSAMKRLFPDPVGGPSAAFEALGETRAKGAGIAFAVLFVLLVTVGIYLALPKWSRPGFGDILKLALWGLVPFASLAGAFFLARRIIRSQGSFGSDLFIAGAALIPAGLLALATGLLGIGNFEVITVLGVFAASHTLLMLYGGCTRVSKMSDASSAVAIPVILLFTAWISKVIFAAAIRL